MDQSKSAFVQIKRIYEKFSDEDGYRVLVDRLWPRGISKEAARLDEWTNEIAPSTDLRKWFNHDPEKFTEFSNRYTGELAEKHRELQQLIRRANGRQLTLLYAARDNKHNHAIVLKHFLDEHFKKRNL